MHLDAAHNEFFHNTATGESTYEHPLDQHYRQLYQQQQKRKKDRMEEQEMKEGKGMMGL